MFAQTRKIKQERILVLSVNIALDIFQIDVIDGLNIYTAQIVVPCSGVVDLFHLLAGQVGDRLSCHAGFHARGFLKILIIKRKGLVVVVNLRQFRVGEDAGEKS